MVSNPERFSLGPLMLRILLRLLGHTNFREQVFLVDTLIHILKYWREEERNIQSFFPTLNIPEYSTIYEKSKKFKINESTATRPHSLSPLNLKLQTH